MRSFFIPACPQGKTSGQVEEFLCNKNTTCRLKNAKAAYNKSDKKINLTWDEVFRDMLKNILSKTKSLSYPYQMEIQELVEFFKNCTRPQMPVFLNDATEVIDFDLFIESHLTPLRANPDSKMNKALLVRLKMKKLIIESN